MGFMAAFVAGILAWGLGGPMWFAVLAVLYLLYSSIRSLIDLAHQVIVDFKALATTAIIIVGAAFGAQRNQY